MDWLGVVAIVLAVLVAGFAGMLVLAARRRKRSLPPTGRSSMDVLAKVGPLPIPPPVPLRLDGRGVPLPPVAYREPVAGEPDAEPDGAKEKAAARGRKAALDHRQRISGEQSHADNAGARIRRRQCELQAKVDAEEKAFAEVRSEASIPVEAADKALKVAQAINRQVIGGVPERGVVVWEHQIKVDGATHPMSGRVRATVDTTGSLQFLRGYHTTTKTPFDIRRNRRTTITTVHERTDAFDTRQLFLLVEGDEFAASVRLDPTRTAEAYELAATISQAAKRYDAGEQRRTEAVLEATKERERAVAARSVALKEPKARLLAARAELDEFVRAPFDPAEGKAAGG